MPGLQDNAVNGELKHLQNIFLQLQKLGINIETIAPNLPDQTGNAGKALYTDGSNASWSTVPLDLGVPTIQTANYGTTVILNTGKINKHVVFTGAGVTDSTVDIDGLDIGSIVIISDLDAKANAHNITVDAGAGNTIRTTTANVQTTVMSTNGQAITLQKVTSSKWILI